MNEESRDYVQILAKKLEEKFGSEIVEIFYEYFSENIEKGMTTGRAGYRAYQQALDRVKEDETLTAMG